MAAGKVEIGAFRTYPDGYQPASAAASQFEHVPSDKVADFGVHANQFVRFFDCCVANQSACSYYRLEVSYFKSTSDEAILKKLWNRYWVQTLTANAILIVRRVFIVCSFFAHRVR